MTEDEQTQLEIEILELLLPALQGRPVYEIRHVKDIIIQVLSDELLDHLYINKDRKGDFKVTLDAISEFKTKFKNEAVTLLLIGT